MSANQNRNQRNKPLLSTQWPSVCVADKQRWTATTQSAAINNSEKWCRAKYVDVDVDVDIDVLSDLEQTLSV